MSTNIYIKNGYNFNISDNNYYVYGYDYGTALKVDNCSFGSVYNDTIQLARSGWDGVSANNNWQRNAAGIGIGYSSNISKRYDNVLNNINDYTTGILVRHSDSIYVKRNSIEGTSEYEYLFKEPFVLRFR